MNPLLRYVAFLVVLIATSWPQLGHTNDFFAEVAAGGIRIAEQKDISLQREELRIDYDNVKVSYWFRNNSDKEISSLVAFPVPEYRWDINGNIPDFKEFTVEVNANPVEYQTEIKAMVGTNDHTAMLKQAGFSIPDFDGFDPFKNEEMLLNKLNPEKRDTLKKAGVLDFAGIPRWTVSIKHYWQQNFPAKSVVRIKHTYKARLGRAYFPLTMRDEAFKEFKKIACLSPQLQEWVNVNLNKGKMFINWLKYILTTANSWSGPIKEFNMVIAKPAKKFVVICLDEGPIEETASNIIIKRKDYEPSAELGVYYIY